MEEAVEGASAYRVDVTMLPVNLNEQATIVGEYDYFPLEVNHLTDILFQRVVRSEPGNFPALIQVYEGF